MLVTADWHLTDAPQDNYRWLAFDHIRALCAEHQIRDVCIMGDLTDRKDRHSAELVNRMIAELRKCVEEGLSLAILMGNHDKPLKGTPYWEFLTSAFGDQVRFIAL